MRQRVTQQTISSRNSLVPRKLFTYFLPTKATWKMLQRFRRYLSQAAVGHFRGQMDPVYRWSALSI